MAGELSPDGNFYWDGQRWTSATSPDGAWRWDGATWRPARSARGRKPWFATAVALTVTVSIVLGVIGIYYAGRALINASPRFFQGGAFSSTCGSPLTQPGAPLSSGDSLCGGTLGIEDVMADCTLASGAPAGMTLWQKTYDGNNASDWTKTSVSSSPDGCNLSAAPNVYLSFETTARQPAETVVVADFVWEASQNNVGLRLACSAEASCVDLSMFSEGLFSLDEGRPNDGWDTLSKGFSLAAAFRQGSPNRMILRLHGRHVSGYLNGVDVVQADTHRVQSPGYVDFYLDNRDATVNETVWLQRLYVFESQ